MLLVLWLRVRVCATPVPLPPLPASPLKPPAPLSPLAKGCGEEPLPFSAPFEGDVDRLPELSSLPPDPRRPAPVPPPPPPPPLLGGFTPELGPPFVILGEVVRARDPAGFPGETGRRAVELLLAGPGRCIEFASGGLPAVACAVVCAART